MKVKVFGTSCSWFKRNNTSFLIDDDIVFDVPSGAYKYISRETDITKLRCIIITHFHSDHFADFHLFATNYMRFLHKGRKEKLRVYAPKGILDLLVNINKLMFGGVDECDKEQLSANVDYIELFDGMTFEEGEYKITAYKVEHGRPETYGFSFCDKNGKIVSFSADTARCENLDKMLQNADYAFVEMSAPTQHKTHLSIEDFENLVKEFSNTKIFAIHTCDECQEYAIKNNLNYVNDGDEFEF